MQGQITYKVQMEGREQPVIEVVLSVEYKRVYADRWEVKCNNNGIPGKEIYVGVGSNLNNAELDLLKKYLTNCL